MTLLDVMLKRRSIRKYTDDKISDEDLNKILTAGLLAPTSRNRKPCEFIVVKDKDTLKKLSKAKKSGSDMLKDANVAIAVFADTKKADTWIEDSSIALTYMDLMAASLGIGSCWCQFHLRSSLLGNDAEDTACEVLGMDDNYRIVGVLSLGVTKDQPEPHTLDDIDKDKIHYVN